MGNSIAFPVPGPPIDINGTRISAPPKAPSQVYQTLTIFARLNLFLALFNLIPVLPLDGARLLHSWLHRYIAGLTANRITGGIGVILSIVWIPMMFAAFFTFGFILAFFPNLFLHWRMMRRGAA